MALPDRGARGAETDVLRMGAHEGKAALRRRRSPRPQPRIVQVDEGARQRLVDGGAGGVRLDEGRRRTLRSGERRGNRYGEWRGRNNAADRVRDRAFHHLLELRRIDGRGVRLRRWWRRRSWRRKYTDFREVRGGEVPVGDHILGAVAHDPHRRVRVRAVRDLDAVGQHPDVVRAVAGRLLGGRPSSRRAAPRRSWQWWSRRRHSGSSRPRAPAPPAGRPGSGPPAASAEWPGSRRWGWNCLPVRSPSPGSRSPNPNGCSPLAR